MKTQLFSFLFSFLLFFLKGCYGNHTQLGSGLTPLWCSEIFLVVLVDLYTVWGIELSGRQSKLFNHCSISPASAFFCVCVFWIFCLFICFVQQISLRIDYIFIRIMHLKEIESSSPKTIPLRPSVY